MKQQKGSMYIYFGLLDHLQELHETEKMKNLLGVLYERCGERAGAGVVKTCLQHSTMKVREREENRGTTRKLIVVLGLLRINFSCILLPISKEERYLSPIVRSVKFSRFSYL